VNFQVKFVKKQGYMKKVFLLVGMFISLQLIAQKKGASISLNKGQKILVRTTANQEADMGMGMEMKNNTSTQNTISVIDADGTQYTISNTLTGIKLSMDFMGQQTNYDSDLKEDSASEIGKSLQNLNIPDTVSVNKKTAEVISHKDKTEGKKEDASNPMETLFESLGNTNADVVVNEAFFIIPLDKKMGDSWIDSLITKDQKTYKTFTLKSIEKNIATIEMIGKVESNIQTETQGLQVSVVMTTKTNTEIIADTNTSLVNKRTTKADITGTLELMGQTAPITGKATTISIYEH